MASLCVCVPQPIRKSSENMVKESMDGAKKAWISMQSGQ